jgi:hypothetical protein
MTSPAALAIVWSLYGLAMLMGLAYFARYRMAQPALGVMNLSDVALAVVCIVLVPLLHLALPAWASTLFLALVMGGLYYLALEPLTPRRVRRGSIALAAVALGVAAPWIQPGNSHVYTTINNVLILVAVVAIANVWVQSGLSVRHLVVLSLAVAVYDLIFTGRLTVTADLFTRLDHRPFEPILAWREGTLWPAIGLGDSLMASAFVVGLYKAWGRGAAALGIAAMLLLLPPAFLRPLLGTVFVTDAYPTMVFIAPVQLLVYLGCRRRFGPERTLAQARAGTRSAPGTSGGVRPDAASRLGRGAPDGKLQRRAGAAPEARFEGRETCSDAARTRLRFPAG